MKTDKIILNRIIVTLTKDGFDVKNIEYHGFLKNNSYNVTNPETGKRKRIKEGAILQPMDSLLIDRPHCIQREVWCFPDKKIEAEITAIGSVKDVVNKFKIDIDHLAKHTYYNENN